MEGHCSTGQSPQWAVVPMEEEVMRPGNNFAINHSRVAGYPRAAGWRGGFFFFE